ncbi:GDSL esterase/lipase At4g10955-like [Carex rostrata]
MDDFRISGPVHLRSKDVNWTCPNDQRVVVASLVQASYITEKDSVAGLVKPELLATAWCEHFHFDFIEVLRDDKDSSVCGCIFEFKPPFPRHPLAPRFVVALRGTMPDQRHGIQDIWLDTRVFFGGINKSTRSQTCLNAVRKLISNYQPKDIWLAGHSLGASIATVIGKYFMKTENINLKAFLFNPPFPSISADLFPNVYICKTIFKVGVSFFTRNQHNKSREEFLKLITWNPYLFVNPRDTISASYIPYFKRRKELEGTVIGSLEQSVAAYTSFREICGEFVVPGSEMPHLLPSAILAVNRNECLEKSHGIHQWWQQDASLEIHECEFKLEIF